MCRHAYLKKSSPDRREIGPRSCWRGRPKCIGPSARGRHSQYQRPIATQAYQVTETRFGTPPALHALVRRVGMRLNRERHAAERVSPGTALPQPSETVIQFVSWSRLRTLLRLVLQGPARCGCAAIASGVADTYAFSPSRCPSLSLRTPSYEACSSLRKALRGRASHDVAPLHSTPSLTTAE
jgi:hypothetical protein